MKTKVIKVKLKDGCAIIDYEQKYDDGKIANLNHDHPYLITDDFKAALDRFKKHLAVICDLKESIEIGDGLAEFDPDELTSLKITGLTISGSDENEGVVIVGQKTIGKKVLNLVSPFTKFTDENDAYKFEHELYEDAVHLAYEAELYLFEKKHAVAQLEMFGEDTEDLD